MKNMNSFQILRESQSIKGNRPQQTWKEVHKRKEFWLKEKIVDCNLKWFEYWDPLIKPSSS